jgi:hypothetical protein
LRDPTLRSRARHDFTRGVAITSSIHPDDHTHIEPVRYGKGSNAMGLLSTLMTDGGGRLPRAVKWAAGDGAVAEQWATAIRGPSPTPPTAA